MSLSLYTASRILHQSHSLLVHDVKASHVLLALGEQMYQENVISQLEQSGSWREEADGEAKDRGTQIYCRRHIM
ncbi:hypothetical protein E2C01_006348 [Portunus trituberculatus]|uniref:Uncharacterized protein n=1 Tax=Portunus trituberculatus TaxID=210409 RepID=A0A5B7CWM6_PORTR|nr:hypothetical protein [Portunus trituberculatus]